MGTRYRQRTIGLVTRKTVIASLLEQASHVDLDERLRGLATFLVTDFLGGGSDFFTRFDATASVTILVASPTTSGTVLTSSNECRAASGVSST